VIDRWTHMKKKFFIKTFGCQMNKNDSLIMETVLTEHGFERSDNQAAADVYIVNTCTVRAHAENRALAYISGLQQWRQQGKRVLAVAGCLAREKAAQISRKMDFVDLILGPDSYRQIGDYILEAIRKETKIIDTKLDDETYCGIFPRTSQVVSFVSIMRGCSNYCSYCIVPYVRGKARSRQPDDICREVRHLVQCGVMDITLLGQNVNEYRYDKTDFACLLAEVSATTGLFRLRFLTSHPKDFDKATVKVIKDQPNICEWLHLPLQSGNDRILELMNRKYTVSEYRALIDHIRKEIPEARITTDVIVGFPSETEDEFQETVALFKEIRFDDAYMYRYSTRPSTKANRLKPLDEPIIKRRLSELIKIQNTITREKTEQMIGKRYEILIEGLARGNASRGKTRGNKDIVVEKNIAPGTVMNVLITQVKGHTPIGETINKDA
jgi:tRNA-2-methylthio-N6-dimethylallyladenosine synthase